MRPCSRPRILRGAQERAPQDDASSCPHPSRSSGSEAVANGANEARAPKETGPIRDVVELLRQLLLKGRPAQPRPLHVRRRIGGEGVAAIFVPEQIKPIAGD
jgi:hypothetical protein